MSTNETGAVPKVAPSIFTPETEEALNEACGNKSFSDSKFRYAIAGALLQLGRAVAKLQK